MCEMFDKYNANLISKGKKEGKKEGEKEAKRKIAKNMLDLKIDIETISQATGLTKEEIQELNENN